MEPDEKDLAEHFTGRVGFNPEGYTEAYAVVGRRGGKSRISATIAAYESLYGGWEKRLAKGERAWVFVIASDKSQAQMVFGYIRGLLDLFPGVVERATTEELHLASGVSIAVKTCSYRGTRGFSTCCVIADEVAFWRDAETAANPASEVIASLLPGLIEGGRLLGISTPYGRFGYLYDIFKTHYGQDASDILVWRAPTMAMNPSYSEKTIARLIARDPAVFRAEYEAEFREDISNFLPESLIRLSMTREPALPDPRLRYTAFIDPSGGRQDSMTLAIVHRESEKIVLDRVEERVPPFDPGLVVAEFAGLLKSFGIHSVVSDRYGGVWVEDSFRKNGIGLTMSEASASDLYLEFQPLLSMGRVELLNDERLALQLQCLERRTRVGGKDLITHPEGGHDDVANSVAGAVATAARDEKWTPEEMEARMPQTVNRMPAALRRPLDKAIADQRSAAQEMDDFMKESGGTKVIRRR